MQELNRQMMALPELRELEEIIRFGTGPAAVSGVSGVHRAMLGAALRQETKRPLAVLCADEAGGAAHGRRSRRPDRGGVRDALCPRMAAARPRFCLPQL